MAEQAGVLHRTLAVVIDHIILAIVTLIIIAPLGLLNTGLMNPGIMYMNPGAWAMNGLSIMAMIAVVVVLWILYFPYFESRSGQTPGKKVMGIKVVKENGKTLSFGDALIRTVLRIIDWLPAAYIVGLVVILVSKNKQRVGDMAAKTIVVRV
jgi:uncharacterized RDD family membrane protein YckC